MTAAAHSPADPGGRIERYIAHRASGALLSTGLTVVALDVAELILPSNPVADVIHALVYFAFLGITALNFAHRLRVRHKICTGCSEDIPDDVNATIARYDRHLRFVHAQDNVAWMLTLLAVGVTGAILMFLNYRTDNVWLDTTTQIAVSIAFLWIVLDGRANHIHRKLRPWCPYCRDDWPDEGEPEPSPDPSGHNHPAA